MRLGLSQMSTMQATFDEDVPAYAAAGFEGIGLLEMKLPEDDAENLRKIEKAGLQVSNCIITVLTILPIRGVVLPEANWRGIDFEGPDDVEERIQRISAAIRRLGPYRPSSITVSFGSPAGYETEAKARAALIEGLKRIAAVADESGVRLAIEPVNGAIVNTMGQTIQETAEIIDEADVAGPVGILIDTWHSGDQPGLFDDLRNYGDRIIGVHLMDRSVPGDGNRLLPGTGTAPLVDMMRELRAHGYDSFIDAELFSPNHLWNLPMEETVALGYEATKSIVDASAQPK